MLDLFAPLVGRLLISDIVVSELRYEPSNGFLLRRVWLETAVVGFFDLLIEHEEADSNEVDFSCATLHVSVILRFVCYFNIPRLLDVVFSRFTWPIQPTKAHRQGTHERDSEAYKIFGQAVQPSAHFI